MTRRLRRFTFDPVVFPGALRTGNFVEILEGIPMDAEFRGFAHDVERNVLTVFVEHPSYDIVPENEAVPLGGPVQVRSYSDKAIQVFKKFIKNLEGM